MRVCFDYRIFFQQRYGGISRYFFEVGKYLAEKQDVGVSVLAPFFVNQYLRHPSKMEIRGSYLSRLPARAFPLVDGANAVFSNACLAFLRPDILHESYYSDSGLRAGKAARFTTVYDMIHEKFPQFYPGDHTARMKAKSVARADHIFCISQKTQDDLIEILGVEREKTSVVHLGCDFSNRIEEAARDPGEPPYILFVGPRGAHKNFLVLLSAFAASDRIRKDFNLVCFGSTPFSSKEQEAFKRLGLAPGKVKHVVGDDSLLPSYYAHARAFVYPSLYEGFGFPPLEAMSLGCVTVAAAAGSMPEILGDSVAYFNPCDPDELKHVLEGAVYDEGWRRAITPLGSAKANSYPWESTAEKTLKQYNSLR